MESNHDFEPMMKQLIQLLNKILSHHFPPGKFSELGSYMKDKSVNFNVYFLNVAPFPEDLEDWEDFSAGGGSAFDGEEDGNTEGDRDIDMTHRLSHSDMEFLRRHGIRF